MQNYAVVHDSHAMVSSVHPAVQSAPLIDAAGSLAHLSDAALLCELASLIARERVTTASLLVYLAEVDSRGLYVPAGYPSLHVYCVEELHFSEDGAKRRIQAARAVRRFPALLTAVAEGRLHLTAVCLLAPHLEAENVDALIEAASHKRKSEIEGWLGRRFPRGKPEATEFIKPLISDVELLAPAHPETAAPTSGSPLDEGALAHLEFPGQDVPSQPERYLIQVTIQKSTHDKLRYAQALLSHALPSGDLSQVFERALDSLIARLEKRKFGGITRRTRRPRAEVGRRCVPAHVRRAVWERDQGQCTFVSASGVRCKSRRFLEFDHVDPVARGGRATVDNLRLRCRAHNQYEAKRVFGSQFMKRKRLGAAEAKARALAEERAAKELVAKEQTKRDQVKDVFAGLRSLGCRIDEARRAAAFTESLGDASLEERMRTALGFLSRKLISTSG
jgi:5-methylcytosine-specific restriction endonuclease McrA